MMCNTVVFDIGNVLAGYDYLSYARRLLKDEEVIRHVVRAVWEMGYWSDLDRGDDPGVVLAHMLEAEPDHQDEIRRTFANAGQCISRLDYAIPWIRSLKERGCRVLYLSNYSRYMINASLSSLDFLPCMDGGVFSGDIRCNKPDPKIYRTLIDTYALDPAGCVFIDDMKENLQAAETFGMKTIWFQSYDQARKELEELLTGNDK